MLGITNEIQPINLGRMGSVTGGKPREYSDLEAKRIQFQKERDNFI